MSEINTLELETSRKGIWESFCVDKTQIIDGASPSMALASHSSGVYELTGHGVELRCASAFSFTFDPSTLVAKSTITQRWIF